MLTASNTPAISPWLQFLHITNAILFTDPPPLQDHYTCRQVLCHFMVTRKIFTEAFKRQQPC